MEINGIYCRVESYAFWDLLRVTSWNISQSLIQCTPYIQPASITKRITRSENCVARVRSRTPIRITSPICIVCSRMSDTRRVEGPFTTYSGDPWGFPPYCELSHPPILDGLYEILERDGRRPCREYEGEEKGKLSAMLSGVCPRVETRPWVSMTTSFGPDQPEVTAAMRDALNPPTGSRCKRKFGGSRTREERIRRPGGSGRGRWVMARLAGKKWERTMRSPGDTATAKRTLPWRRMIDDDAGTRDIRMLNSPTGVLVCPLFPLRHVDTRFNLIIGFT